MPTDSGEGYADYVLYGDDGKPLAVIEAKKTAKDPRQGAEQARIYAAASSKRDGQAPGHLLHQRHRHLLWDDVQGYPYRKIYGFYSKDSLEYLPPAQEPEAAGAPSPQPEHRRPHLPNRGGEARLRALSDEARKALLVQATGTVRRALPSRCATC
jgi:type I restriction enzyme R subunit